MRGLKCLSQLQLSLDTDTLKSWNCEVTTSQTAEGQGKAAGPRGRAGTTAPKQTSRSGGSRSRGCACLRVGQQAPRRRPCHCPGRTTANSANTNSKTNNMNTSLHSLQKVRQMRLGRARTQETVRLQIHKKMSQHQRTP